MASSQGEVYHHPLQMDLSPTFYAILRALEQNGMRALIVGGAVRDRFIGHNSKDLDVEVYGATKEQLVNVLSPFGRVDAVGKSFGVVKLTDPEGNDYDFSLARRDNKTGPGHRDFEVILDPKLTPPDAASRRDYTWNAMAYDPLTEMVHDYYGGRKDLKNKWMRHTSEAFAEDPLRVLRGMQFTSRFGHQLDPATAEMSKQLRDHIIQHISGFSEQDLRAMQHPKHEWHPKGIIETDPATGRITPRSALSWYLPRPRLEGEWMKWAALAKKPSAILQYLHETGWDAFFPEIAGLKNVPQEPEWHPEGDVGTHTGHVLDAAARIADREGLTGDARAVNMFAALGHDFAKGQGWGTPEAITQQLEKGGKMRWTAHGHEKAGGPLVEQFLRGIGVKPEIIQQVVPLVENHLMHINFEKQGVRPSVVKKLARRLYPANVEQLAHLIEADMGGRPPLRGGLPASAKRMVELAQQYQVHKEPERPWIMGRHLIDRGYQPGPWFGALLKEAAAAQENGDIPTEAHAPAWLDNRLAQEDVTQPVG